MGRKPISDSVKKRLFALSGNQCSFPGCTQPIYDTELEVLLGEICHINGVNPAGPRYDSDFTEELLNSLENLVLLCPTHHTVIDRNVDKYTVSALRLMKAYHESKVKKLIGTNKGEITLDKLQELDVVELAIRSEEDPLDLPPKKIYSPPRNYITRNVTSIKERNQVSFDAKTLIDIIDEEQHITLLGVAGSGKSIELDYVAHHYSQTSTNYYPIKLRLNVVTQQPIEELLATEFPSFSAIPTERLLVILDALDEVHSDYLDIVSRNILGFSKKYKNAKILVSCRNNFYTVESENRRAKLDGFSTYLINPLDEYSTNRYITSQLASKAEDFIENLKIKKYYQLSFSPFYLVNLVQYYKSRGDVPESRDTIFNFLIRERVEADIEKYINVGVRLEDYGLRVKESIEKLAIVAECLGKNYLDEQSEVRPLIADIGLFEVIKRTFLFNRSPGDKRWEFEHNNFQEFLAATYLSRLSFSSIQKFISFDPDYNKIKPSWLNTVSFLFSILDSTGGIHQKLLSWIKRIEPDILVRFEKDKIPLSTREDLFRQIFQQYESRGIVIRNEKFESEDLAHFVSDSQTILKYLLDRISESDEDLLVSEALRLIPYFDAKTEYRNQIIGIGQNILTNRNLSDSTKYTCFHVLARLNLSTKSVITSFLENNDLESSQYIRAGFYRYLQCTDFYEDYIEILFKGINWIEQPVVRVNGRSENRDTHLADEQIHLEAVLEKVDSPDGVAKFLKWASVHEETPAMSNIFMEQVKLFLNKAISTYNNGHKILYDIVFNLMRSFSRRYYGELEVELRNFFVETGTATKAFNTLFKRFISSKDGDANLYLPLSITCTVESVEFLIEEIKAGRLKDPEVWRIRNFIGGHGDRNTYDVYQAKLVDIDEERYGLKQIDYKALEVERRNKDVRLLLDKNSFIQEVNQIFDSAGTENKLTQDDLYNFRNEKLWEEQVVSEVAVDLLRDKSLRSGSVKFDEIKKLIVNEKNWEWFVVHKLLNYDTSIKEFQYDQRTVDFLKSWVDREMESANFKTAIKYKNKRYQYRYKELYLAYLIQRLDIELNMECCLDFLYVDCSLLPSKESREYQKDEKELSATQDYLVNKLGVEAVTKKVVAILQDSEIVPLVRQSLFGYCHFYDCKEITPIMLDYILNQGIEDFDRRRLVTQYFDLLGEFRPLFEKLNWFSLEIRLQIVEELIKREYPPIKDYTISEIEKTNDEDVRLSLIQKISIIEPEQAFGLLKEWIFRNKRLPERSYTVKFIPGANLPDLIMIFEDSLENNYGTGTWNNRNDYLKPMIELASKTDSSYVMLKEKFNDWINRFDKMKYLHYQLQYLEQEYYSKKSETLDYKSILQLIGGEEGKTHSEAKSGFVEFWQAHKAVIEIVLALITLLGFLLVLL